MLQKSSDKSPVITQSLSFIMLGLLYFDMMHAMKNYEGKVLKVKNAKMQIQESYSEMSVFSQ